MRVENRPVGQVSYTAARKADAKQTTPSFGTMYKDTLDVFYRDLADSKTSGIDPETTVTTPGHLPSA